LVAGKRLSMALDRGELRDAQLAGAELAHDLGALAAGVVDPLALAAGTRWVPVGVGPRRVRDDAGLDGDSLGACSGRRYGATDVTSEHSLAAEGSAVARWLGPDDVERDTRFELATFSLGS
jgi:hypothetical protein